MNDRNGGFALRCRRACVMRVPGAGMVPPPIQSEPCNGTGDPRAQRISAARARGLYNREGAEFFVESARRIRVTVKKDTRVQRISAARARDYAPI